MPSILEAKRIDWATAFAKTYDNACLAVNGVMSVAADRPHTSVYQALRTTDSGISYTADTNYVAAGDNLGAVTFTDTGDIVTFLQPHGLKVNDKLVVGTVTSTTGITAGTTYYVRTVPSTTTVTLSATLGGATLALTTDGSSVSATVRKVSYLSMSRAIGIYEQGDFFDDGNSVIIAHPFYKQACRDLLNLNGDPVLVVGGKNQGDTLLDYPVEWSLGCKVSTAATPSPTGNPIFVVGNKSHLIVGRRSGPESFVADPQTVGFATDETKLKVRARRAFAIGHPGAFAAYESI